MAGASLTQLRRLQSVLNAAARLVCSASKYEIVTGLLHQLHWLKVPEWINFRLCVLMHHCLHEGEPAYLAKSVRRTYSRNIRRHTRSTDTVSASEMTYIVSSGALNSTHSLTTDTVTLLVPPTRRSTLGDRAFPVAAARAWNALPARVRSEPSVSIFRRHLKTYLFYVSFPEQTN